MGAWGHASFDNDDALDWIDDLRSSGQSAILEALDRVLDEAHDGPEAPDCSEALAAAEVVAALRGRPASNLPEEVRAWVSGKPAPGEQLIARALAATNAIYSDSELRNLWEESNDCAKWQAQAKELQLRLA